LNITDVLSCNADIYESMHYLYTGFLLLLRIRLMLAVTVKQCASIKSIYTVASLKLKTFNHMQLH